MPAKLIFAATTMLAGASLCSAQVATGTITGTVTDPSGASVPKAAVVINHVDTNLSRTVYTDETGSFRATLLPVGTYSVSAEFTGFKKKVITGLELRVDQTTNITVALETGALAETVTVEGTSPLLESQTSSVGQVITNDYIRNIPLNGRNPYALGLLSGHTTPTYGTSADGLPFVAGGGRYTSNEVLLDGVDNNSYIGRGIAYTPNVDAVQEFKVKTGTYSAEFGKSAGMTVNATMRAGSNRVNGTLTEFMRNDKFDANNFFTNAAGLKKSPLRRNQFGGTLGGPVYIPKVYNGHDRTFFFVDYEGLRVRSGASSTLLDIPPLAFRKGDLSAYNQALFDPNTRRLGSDGRVTDDPFPGKIIPTNRIHAGAAATAALLPEPNVGAADAQSRNYLRQVPSSNSNDQYDIRIDQRVTVANTFFGRYSDRASSTPNPGRFPGFIGGGSDAQSTDKQLALTDTHIFSPTLLNEARMGYRRSNDSSISFKQDGAEFALKNNIGVFPFPVLGFPEIDFNYSGQRSGAVQFSELATGGSSFSIENVFQFADNVTMTRGKHSFKTGADVRRIRFDRQTGGIFNGRYFFGSIYTSNPQTPGSGGPWADFLLGLPSLIEGDQQLDWTRLRQIYAGAFFQDDWRISRRLTINAGVRYDLFTAPVDARDRGSLFDTATARFALPGKDGYTRAVLNGDHNNFAPRFGIAWQARPRLVIRSGYGIYFGDSDRNSSSHLQGSQIPNVPIITAPVVDAQRTVTPPYTLSTPIRIEPYQPDLNAFSAANPIVRTFFAPDLLHTVSPYLQQYSFSIQYEAAANWLLEVSYEGSKGTKLGDRLNLNQEPFQYALDGRNTQANRRFAFINGLFAYDQSTATSNYNSVNFKVERRFSSGLAFLVNYSIQKTLERGVPGVIGTFTQNGGTSLPLDSFDGRREITYSPLDVPQTLTASYSYELPIGTHKKYLVGRGPAGKILGGWMIAGITSLRGGFPTDVRFATAPPNFATFNVPDRVSGQPLTVSNPGPDQFFNPAAFSAPPSVLSNTGVRIQTYGNSAKRPLRGPGSAVWDFGLFKNTAITERVTLQFRSEFFNLFNTPQFGLASASSASLTYGNAAFGKLVTSASVGRQIQFGLKLVF
jgi:Carboxypeptidase regulatory-like domain